jgi:hypothetical protein
MLTAERTLLFEGASRTGMTIGPAAAVRGRNASTAPPTNRCHDDLPLVTFAAASAISSLRENPGREDLGRDFAILSAAAF